MDRRDFLWVTASAGAGVAAAGVPSLFTSAPVAVDLQKRAGRVMVTETVTAQVSSGAFPFALSRFATDASFLTAPRQVVAGVPSVLSPVHDVIFHGFSNGAGTFVDDHLQVVAVFHAPDGVTARYDLWSQTPKRFGGGSSQSLLFTAHDDAFGGFEITHIPAVGARTSGLFNFAGAGRGPMLKAGVYVLAGPGASTGVAPDLGRFAYSGNMRAPVSASRAVPLDFSYISFAVHSEWL